MRGRRIQTTLDSTSSETIHSFFFLQGLFMGMATEYNMSQLRLMGLASNESEVIKYGKLSEIKLLQEIFSNRYPAVNVEKINFERVRLKKDCLIMLEAAMKAKFPFSDLSSLHFQHLYTLSDEENRDVIDLIVTAGYPVPSDLFDS